MGLKGREIQLKLGQFLHYSKEKVKYSPLILFHDKALAPYRKIESVDYLTFSFG